MVFKFTTAVYIELYKQDKNTSFAIWKFQILQSRGWPNQKTNKISPKLVLTCTIVFILMLSRWWGYRSGKGKNMRNTTNNSKNMPKIWSLRKNVGYEKVGNYDSGTPSINYFLSGIRIQRTVQTGKLEINIRRFLEILHFFIFLGDSRRIFKFQDSEFLRVATLSWQTHLLRNTFTANQKEKSFF